jgi:hypothetical protein
MSAVHPREDQPINDAKNVAFIAEIMDKAGSPCGMGILIASDQVITCAHVVNLAMKRSADESSTPGDDVRIDVRFPFKDGDRRKGKVVGWYAPVANMAITDICVLSLTQAIGSEAKLAQFAIGKTRDKFRACRRTGEKSILAWVYGEIGDPTNEEKIEVRKRIDTNGFLAPGCSGGPIVSEVSGHVLGMVVWANQENETGHVTPTLKLQQAHPLPMAISLFTCPIDLTLIRYDEAEEKVLSDSLLSAMDGLPEKLVNFALADTHASLENIDDILPCNNAIRARNAASQYREMARQQEWKMTQQLTQVHSAAREMEAKVDRIKSARVPTEPTKPSPPESPHLPEFYSEDQRRMVWKQYDRELNAHPGRMADYERKRAEYELELAKYREGQAKLTTLEAELYSRSRDEDRIANEIASFRLEQQRREVENEQAISNARDLDMTVCINELIDHSTSLLSGAGSLEGFAYFLLAAELNEKFQRQQQSSIHVLTDVFSKRKVTIENSTKKRMEEIARACLASVPELQRALAKGRLEEMSKVLSQIPEGELADKLLQLRRLCDFVLPKVPYVFDLIAPTELSEARQRCMISIESVSKHIALVEDELGEKGHDFAEQVDTARVEVARILSEVGTNKLPICPPALQASILFTLASRASKSAFLEGWLTDFCESIVIESERRAGFPFQNIPQSVKHGFLDISEIIIKHPSTEYLRLREELRSNQAGSEARDRELRQAVVDINKQPERNRHRILSRLRLVVVRTVIPFYNLVDSIRLTGEVTRLEHVLKSTDPAYIDLGKRGKRCIGTALVVSLFVAVGCIFILWREQFATRPSDLVENVLYVLALVYVWNVIQTAVNLHRWVSLANERSRERSKA